MKKQYSVEFKIEAIKRLEKSGESLNKIATELGVRPTTMHGLVKKYRESPDTPFPGSGRLKPEDEKLRR
ncbi:hypothetical protein WY13_01934 [Clostridium ljungdahlii]|uniref:Transposase n=1 Tax=Clostridium ljungdahlii TaxID=1538 RepID=A0A168PCJ9_9CLOT|nr:hypothetical protein WY13_01934 [Clostridium ljungdahlii]